MKEHALAKTTPPMAERLDINPEINCSVSSTACRVEQTMSGDTLITSALWPGVAASARQLPDLARHSQGRSARVAGRDRPDRLRRAGVASRAYAATIQARLVQG